MGDPLNPAFQFASDFSVSGVAFAIYLFGKWTGLRGPTRSAKLSRLYSKRDIDGLRRMKPSNFRAFLPSRRRFDIGTFFAV